VQHYEVRIKPFNLSRSFDSSNLIEFNYALNNSKARSPYIIHYYGSCLQPQVSVVVEYCMRGSLYDAMQDEFLDIAWDRVFKVPFFLPNPFKSNYCGLPVLLYQWARELTTAIQMLHTFDPPIYHRDLKSPNILVPSYITVSIFVLTLLFAVK